MVIGNPWLTWFKGAFLPALVGLAVTPLILYQVRPCPKLRYSPLSGTLRLTRFFSCFASFSRCVAKYRRYTIPAASSDRFGAHASTPARLP